MLSEVVKSRIAIALRTLAFTAIFACAASGAWADNNGSVITRASFISGAGLNAPATLLIHGSFGAGNIPVVRLGDVSTATTSGTPASPDLVVTSFSTTDIAVTVSNPIDSGILPATYRLQVRTFNAAEREWNAAEIDLSIAASDVGALVFSGVVEALALPSVTVGGKVVAVTPQTRISSGGSPVSLADLHAGDRIAVTAQAQADGSLLALAIVRLP